MFWVSEYLGNLRYVSFCPALRCLNLAVQFQASRNSGCHHTNSLNTKLLTEILHHWIDDRYIVVLIDVLWEKKKKKMPLSDWCFAKLQSILPSVSGGM